MVLTDDEVWSSVVLDELVAAELDRTAAPWTWPVSPPALVTVREMCAGQ